MTPIDHAQKICYSSHEVLRFTYSMALKYRNLPGAYLEAGVAAGAQVIALLHGGGPNKKVYALDSYMGLPFPSNRDDQMPGVKMLSRWEQAALPDPGEARLESTGAVVVSVDDFINQIKTSGVDHKSLFIIEGWFEETLPTFTCPELSILRLDSDLYNSTWVCLQHLFQKVIQGGCVIIDDWTLPGCQAACKEYFELIGYEPEYKFLDGTAYFFK